MTINCIPNNIEKYMVFMLGKRSVFIHSFQFMGFSLDSLVKNLPDEALICTAEEFKEDELNLVKKKGIYCYDYIDSFEKFE